MINRSLIHPLTFRKIKLSDVKMVKNKSLKYGFYHIENTSIRIINAHEKHKKMHYGQIRAKYKIYQNNSFVCCANTLNGCKAIIIDRFTYLF